MGVVFNHVLIGYNHVFARVTFLTGIHVEEKA